MARKKKGQSFMEYAMLYTCVIAALLSIQIYTKRSVEGRLRSSIDDVGQQGDFNSVTETSNINRTGIITDDAKYGSTTVSSTAVIETTTVNTHLEPW